MDDVMKAIMAKAAADANEQKNSSDEFEHHDDAKNEISEDKEKVCETQKKKEPIIPPAKSLEGLDVELTQADNNFKKDKVEKNEHHDDAKNESKKQEIKKEEKPDILQGAKVFFYTGVGAFSVAVLFASYCALKVTGII
jgi:hypothetical protein